MIKLMKRFILIYAIALITHTLTFSTHYSPTPSLPFHAQQPQEQKNITRQHLFTDQLTTITNEVGRILGSLEKDFGKKYPDLIENLKQYKAGLQELRSILIKFNLLVTVKQQQCPKIQTSKQSQIYRIINLTQQKYIAIIHIFQTNLQLQKTKPSLLKIQQQLERYLTHIEQTLEGSFCQTTNKGNQGSAVQKKEKLKNYYKSNLDVSNWFYGSTTQLNYIIYLQNKAAHFKLISCPASHPFVKEKEQKCFNCPPNSIYNLGKENCDSCPSGKVLNVVKNTCEPCFGQIFIIDHQFVCKACALEQEQLFDIKTGKCYKCKVTEYLDVKARACKPIKCPPDQPKYNRELQLCEKCQTNSVIDPNNPTVCIPQCPKQKPLFNNATKTCLECPKNEIYFAETKSCKKIEKPADIQDQNEGQNDENWQNIPPNNNPPSSSHHIMKHSVVTQLLPIQKQPIKN